MSRRETYWRCGYAIEGSASVTVEEYNRTEEQAAKAAKEAAEEVAKRVGELGLSHPVTIWTRRWQTWRETREDDRVDVATIVPRVVDAEAIERRFKDAKMVEARA